MFIKGKININNLCSQVQYDPFTDRHWNDSKVENFLNIPSILIN